MISLFLLTSGINETKNLVPCGDDFVPEFFTVFCVVKVRAPVIIPAVNTLWSFVNLYAKIKAPEFPKPTFVVQ